MVEGSFLSRELYIQQSRTHYFQGSMHSRSYPQLHATLPIQRDLVQCYRTSQTAEHCSFVLCKTAGHSAPVVAVTLCIVEDIRTLVSGSLTRYLDDQKFNFWNAGKGCFIARKTVGAIMPKGV